MMSNTGLKLGCVYVGLSLRVAVYAGLSVIFHSREAAPWSSIVLSVVCVHVCLKLAPLSSAAWSGVMSQAIDPGLVRAYMLLIDCLMAAQAWCLFADAEPLLDIPSASWPSALAGILALFVVASDGAWDHYLKTAERRSRT